MNNIITVIVGFVLLLVGAASGKTLYGGNTIESLPKLFVNGITVGDQGTAIADDLFGTCNATFSGTSLAASSTGQFFFSVTGARSGDLVLVSLPAGAGANAQGAASIYGGFSIAGTYATTTDVIGFNVLNVTGAATTSFRQATTSVQYRIVR